MIIIQWNRENVLSHSISISVRISHVLTYINCTSGECCEVSFIWFVKRWIDVDEMINCKTEIAIHLIFGIDSNLFGLGHFKADSWFYFHTVMFGIRILIIILRFVKLFDTWQKVCNSSNFDFHSRDIAISVFIVFILRLEILKNHNWI